MSLDVHFTTCSELALESTTGERFLCYIFCNKITKRIVDNKINRSTEIAHVNQNNTVLLSTENVPTRRVRIMEMSNTVVQCLMFSYLSGEGTCRQYMLSHSVLLNFSVIPLFVFLPTKQLCSPSLFRTTTHTHAP